MRTEEQLGQEMIAFERKMARLGRRPALPTDQNKERKETRIPQAIERERLARTVREKRFQEIHGALNDLEVLNANQIGERLGCSAQQLNSYLRLMTDAGYLHKLPMREKEGKRKMVYAYIKTGAEIACE